MKPAAASRPWLELLSVIGMAVKRLGHVETLQVLPLSGDIIEVLFDKYTMLIMHMLIKYQVMGILK